ncbi:hypothetical protein [Martelella mediterranea]|uniref:Uncharacterized protein n=1 Tax=Martelella mediterranea DSM 17316 TaxID=1122214 RepID=A0A1U9Z189_9HYPH|nr:hypothetical protein [Martelella mediterranea]AQZ51372.1 hypothetical protein Mame_02034 [Martelella mediterranea DSM 17316]
MTVLYVKSSFEGPSETVRRAAADGVLDIVEQNALKPQDLSRYNGLITSNQLDQNAMLAFGPALEAFLARGGRWFFNGHMVRPLVAGMEQYRPIRMPKRADFDLTAVNTHPIFDGIDLKKLETNKNVAGFYGRGCNPLPERAVAVNGLGPAQVPVDWVWERPGGGRIFSHSGNDLATMGREWELPATLTARIMNWTAGGACIDGMSAVRTDESYRQALAEPETYRGTGGASGNGRRLVLPSSGCYYHIHALEAPRHAQYLDVITTPEALPETLMPDDALWVPCRTPAQRMIAAKDFVAAHLRAGGTVVALGESLSHLWLPNVEFTPTPTNWWWWLEKGADLGVDIVAPEHPLTAGMTGRDVTWHLHGWFTPPDGADVLIQDGEGRAILYVDEASTPGRMIVSSLDPIFHHGSHFMPATTRFLDRFIPNLKEFLNA